MYIDRRGRSWCESYAGCTTKGMAQLSFRGWGIMGFCGSRRWLGLNIVHLAPPSLRKAADVWVERDAENEFALHELY